MSSVMARTPTVTRHSDFMAAAAAAEQRPPGLAGLGLRGRANRGPRPAPPGGAGRSQRLPAPRRRSPRRSPGDALLAHWGWDDVSQSTRRVVPARKDSWHSWKAPARWGWRCWSASLGSAKGRSGKQAEEFHGKIVGGKLAGSVERL